MSLKRSYPETSDNAPEPEAEKTDAPAPQPFKGRTDVAKRALRYALQTLGKIPVDEVRKADPNFTLERVLCDGIEYFQLKE